MKLINDEGISSPILKEFIEKFNEIKNPKKKKEELEGFWEKQTGPLMEGIEEHPDHYMVTFLFKEKSITNELRVFCVAFGFHPTRNIMNKIKGTDIYNKSVYIRRKARLLYSIGRAPTFDDTKYPNQMQDGQNKAFADPLNKENELIISFDDDPNNSWEFTILEMPDTPPQKWMIKDPEVPIGKIDEIYIDLSGELLTSVEEKLKANQNDTDEDEVEKKDEDNPRKYKLQVYTPPGYNDNGERYHLLTCFDGYAYTHPQVIDTPLILDNLISKKAIPPTVGIFIFQNDRGTELKNNPIYADFVANNILPLIREKYHVTNDAKNSVIVGSSYSGIKSMMMGLLYPEKFGNVLCQSGAFNANKSTDNNDDSERGGHLYLIQEFVKRDKVDINIYMEVGTYENNNSYFGYPSFYWSNYHMKDVLELKGYKYKFREYIGGHDYLTWKESIAEGLIHLIGK